MSATPHVLTGPYREPGEPTPEREPVGECPRCGADIWDLAKWKADGKKHADCLGSHSARMGKVVEATISEMDALRDRVAQLESGLSLSDHTRGIYLMQLRNLLARIHRDGGHYVEEHGLEKAVRDADRIVAELHAGVRR